MSKAIQTSFLMASNDERARIIIVALSTSLCLGMLDVTISLLAGPPGLASFHSLFPPLAMSTWSFLIAYLVLWFLIGIPLQRFLRLTPLALAISISMFLTAILVNEWSDITWRVALSRLPHLFSIPSLKSTLLLANPFLLSIGSYFAIDVLAKQWRIRTIAAIGNFALPCVLAVTLVFVWLNEYSLSSPASVSAVSWVGYVVFLLLAIIVARRVGPTVNLEKAMALWTVFVLGSPTVTWLGTSYSASPAAIKAHTSRDVRRVILVTVDTLRPDALSSYSEQATPTPHIDQLAEDGIIFQKAVSAAPWTLPSVASLMTGLPPEVHGATKEDSKLPDSMPTLAEYMRDGGYFTAGIVSNPYLGKQSNISQGFHEYVAFPRPSLGRSVGARVLKKLFPVRYNEASTRELTDLAIDWLERNRNRNFFLWLHYFDPHSPHTPPSDYLHGKPPPTMGKTFWRSADVAKGVFVPSLNQRRWIRTLYDAEVRYVDANVGRLMHAIKRLNIYDDTLIIFTSDHGEEFFEHGIFGHGHSLYNELLFVPLIVKLPNVKSQIRVGSPVAAARIMPTVLDLCDAHYDNDSFYMASLSPFWDPDSNVQQSSPIFSTGLVYREDRVSVMFNGFKYIKYFISQNQEELYNLTHDPTEQVNLAPFRPETVAQGRKRLDEHNDAVKALRKFHGVSKPDSKELDAETKKRLEAVGYVQCYASLV